MHIDEKIVRIAAEGNLVINYSPSHYGQEKYFKFLNNNLVAVSKIEVLASSEKLCGWSMDIWTWSFKKKRVAIFLYQDLI